VRPRGMTLTGVPGQSVSLSYAAYRSAHCELYKYWGARFEHIDKQKGFISK
jgi:hypothetical protein